MFELIMLAGFMAAAISQLLPEEKNGSSADRKHSCRSRPQDKKSSAEFAGGSPPDAHLRKPGKGQLRPLPPKGKLIRQFGAAHRGMQTAVAS